MLSDKYPHFLPRFPPPVRLRIVENMLGRAALWGVQRQRALLAYCEFMIAIAANFDEEAEIRSQLERGQQDIEATVANLPFLVSEQAWERAEANGATLPFYLAPQNLSDPLERQTVMALGLIASDVLRDAAAAQSALAWAAQASARYGLGHLRDALLVLSMCFAFYGPDPDWMTETVREGWSGRALLEAMRLRLALDFGRYV